jgi:hypothetical protein
MKMNIPVFYFNKWKKGLLVEVIWEFYLHKKIYIKIVYLYTWDPWLWKFWRLGYGSYRIRFY